MGDGKEGLIPIAPIGHRLAIRRQGLEAAQGGAGPIRWTEDHGNHAGLTGVMALQGPLELDVAAVRRGQKASAHQAEHDIRGLEIGIDRAVPLLSGADFAVVPEVDHTLTLQGRQVVAQLLAQGFILVGIGDEQADGSHRPHLALHFPPL